MSNLFQVRYVGTTPGVGGAVLNLALVVNAVQKTVSGIAVITQATNPPVQFKADVWGSFNQVQQHISLSLLGNPSGPLSQIAATFGLQGLLDLNWQHGVASYRYSYDGDWRHVADAKLSVVAEHSDLPNPPDRHFLPLYASAMQQAQTSGDLGHIKTLAAHAKQLIDNKAAIAGELQKLEGKIKELS